MFSSRIWSLFFFLVGFGLFACAKPIDTAELVVRRPLSEVSTASNALVARGGGDDILAVLVDLKAQVDVFVGLLDGKLGPSGPVADLVASIQASIDLIVKIKVDVAPTAALLASIVDALVYIVVNIATALGKYPALLIVTLVLKVDLALSLLLKAVIALLPGVLVLLKAALSVHLDLLASIKLVLTLAVVGLGL